MRNKHNGIESRKKKQEMESKQEQQNIAEQAAQWQLILDECLPEDHAAKLQQFNAWQQQDIRHADAAERVAMFLDHMSMFKKSTAHQTLNTSVNSSARKALQASLKQAAQRKHKTTAATLLGLMLLVSVPAAITLQKYPLNYLNADLITAAAQWQNYTLDDGSKVWIAGKSAVDIDFTAQQRVITLHYGEIYIDVAPDTTRPLIVKTQYGAIQALGTRFIVNHLGAYKTRLSMLESKVMLTPTKDNNKAKSIPLIISAGEKINITSRGTSPVTVVDVATQENNWQDHKLLVQGWPLPEVLAELNRFYPGYIHFNTASLQHIIVSAVLPLDKPKQALALLNANFANIKVSHYTPWVVVVNKAKSKWR